MAYIDPGNFATNFSAGAQFGYALVWVVVLANLVAMLVQYESAKLGVASGRDLPEICRERFPRAVSRGLWVQAELVTMATDVAEFVGAAVGLNLLFGIPLFPAGLITAVVAFGILELSQRGHRPFELAIVGLLGDRGAGPRLRPARGRRRTRPASPAGWSRRSRGQESVRAGRRHRGRDGDAARDLPALRADQVAQPLPTTTRRGGG